MDAVKYRVKDEDNNFEDYMTLDELAKDLEINKGTIKRCIELKRPFLGLRFSKVKIKDESSKTKSKKTRKMEADKL